MTLLTEEQAKEKWCPWARQESSGGSFNRYRPQDGNIPPHCCCIASECMAWRVKELRNIAANSTDEAYGQARGYCGLAGEVTE